MVVPNYVPDPIEIPGNVTEQPYRVRLAFMRRVEALHLLSLFIVGLIAWRGRAIDPVVTGSVLGVGLLALAVTRVALRGSSFEWVISTGLLIPVVGSLGLLAGALYRQGVPVWAPAFGALAAFIYSRLSGRDFSFLGQWFLALIASTIGVAAIADFNHLPPTAGLVALLLNAGYLSYLVYDLASLLSRRRLGEEIGAVADLHRDVLNLFGYFIRVAQHWRKHRIWVVR